MAETAGNKTARLFAELHEGEVDLAQHYRRVAERQAADHGTHYPCRSLAQQCDEHAARVRELAPRYGEHLAPPRRSERLDAAVGAVRQKASERAGTRPDAGLLLLRDLRELFLAAQGVHLDWVLLGQVAQAARDEELLADVSKLHAQTLSQVRWIETRVKSAAPQALVAD
ncbi:hypothetical protein WDH52_20065 [Streptomyces sp. TRM70308]|uniref:hypothetical protein n=1 Tax=Streptomyces TaxID=1883 RepID=UPI0022497719|nr:hypothetical protein [Streptomyces sp. JHD 1]MCX2967914.1 hypothetical protein [Streptomyces sp. JHD 1]